MSEIALRPTNMHFGPHSRLNSDRNVVEKSELYQPIRCQILVGHQVLHPHNCTQRFWSRSSSANRHGKSYRQSHSSIIRDAEAYRWHMRQTNCNMKARRLSTQGAPQNESGAGKEAQTTDSLPLLSALTTYSYPLDRGNNTTDYRLSPSAEGYSGSPSSVRRINCTNVVQPSKALTAAGKYLCNPSYACPTPNGHQAPTSPIEKLKHKLRCYNSAHRERRPLQEPKFIEHEARIALAQAGPMAKMQLEVETQDSNNNNVIVDTPRGTTATTFPSVSAKMLTFYPTMELEDRLAELRSRMDALNTELLGCLEERDRLYMERDARLVDVEDLRLQLDEILGS